MFAKRFINKLELQHQANLSRNPLEIDRRDGKYIIVDNRKILNFSSNDYLGLGTSKKLGKKVSENFITYGASSSSSRLVSGNYSIITLAEKKFAEFFGYDEALFFPSGYQANIGVISAFFEPGDKVFFDKHIHASSVKGLILSKSDFAGYNHNSISHLEKRLYKSDVDQAAVVTESLFSMDGDLLNLKDFAELKTKYNFLSIVDEAHAFGVIGEKGRGIARNVADIAIGTFGKAFGFFGAFVLLPKGFKEYMFNFSSPLIYSTTLPEAHAASAIDLLKLIEGSEAKQKHLKNISCYMKESLKQNSFNVTGDAHIIALNINDEQTATNLSRELFNKNIFVFPSRYPTVPKGKAILRISMTALHTKEDVEYFIDTLKLCNNLIM